MPLFHFQIGSEETSTAVQELAEQFLRNPEMFGHRFSGEERDALREPDVLRQLREAATAATVSGQRIHIATSLQSVFVTVHPKPDSIFRESWGGSAR